MLEISPKISEILAATLSDLRSDYKEKGIFRLFSDFFLINLGQKSLLFKQGFPKNIWISSSTQLGEHPNFCLNAEEDFP